MKEQNETWIYSGRRQAIWVGMSCIGSYCSCYIVKNILSAVMPQMIVENAVDSVALGTAGSVYLLTYGVGQFINGQIGNRVDPLYMVLIGLLFPGAMVACFPFCNSSVTGILLWGVCGFLCSMLWGPLSRLIGENSEEKYSRLLLSGMTVASVFGTLVTYALAMLASLLNDYRIAFFVAGFWVLLTAVFWFFAYRYMKKKGLIREKTQEGNTVKPDFRSFLSLFLKGEFLCVIAMTMFNGVIRNAVTFWIPTFMAQYLSIPTEQIAMVSAVLPLINIASTFFSLWALRLTKNNDIKLNAFLFLFAMLLFGGIWLCSGRFVILSVIALFLANAAMTGVCNMIFSVYVLRYKADGMISGVTGFLDAVSYLVAAAASLLFTMLQVRNNWNLIILTWILFTALGAIASILACRFRGSSYSKADSR